jgi:phage gp36-like protein
MSYCTASDLVARFGTDELVHLTDKKRTGRMDDQAIRTAISDATDTINAYLDQTNDPDRFKGMAVFKSRACDIARYLLHTTNVPETVQKRYDNAIEFLSDWLERHLPESGTGTGGSVDSVAPPRLFTMDSMSTL